MKIEISTKPTLNLKKGYPKLMRYVGGTAFGGVVVLFVSKFKGYRFGPNGIEELEIYSSCLDQSEWEPFTGEIKITI